MARIALLLVVLLTCPVARAAVFDNGAVNDVDTDVGSSMVFDSAGGAPTTVNLLAGGRGNFLVNDSSTLNMFSGSEVPVELRYLDSSSGAICGGSNRIIQVFGLANVEINGGTFLNNTYTVNDDSTSTVVIQGGSFESTSGAIAVWMKGVSPEFRGGTIIDGNLTANGSALTISGGSLGPDGVRSVNFATVTIVGTAFNHPFGLLPHAHVSGFLIETLIGTLADGTPVNTPLVADTTADIILVEGSQGPLSSVVCGAVGGPAPVPLLPLAGSAFVALFLLVVVAVRSPLSRRRLLRR